MWPPAFALGLSVSAKLLFWPMFVWMLATRRIRAAALAIVIGLAVTLAAWAAIGFDGLTGYPDLLRRLSEIQAESSYSFVGMAATARTSGQVGQALDARRRRWAARRLRLFARRGDDARSFTCAVAATLALSPIVWLHYLVVLLVPLAIARPRFSRSGCSRSCSGSARSPDTPEGLRHSFRRVAAAILLGRPARRPQQSGSRAARRRRELRTTSDAARRLRAVAHVAGRTLASLVFCGVLPVLVIVTLFVSTLGDDSVASTSGSSTARRRRSSTARPVPRRDGRSPRGAGRTPIRRFPLSLPRRSPRCPSRAPGSS